MIPDDECAWNLLLNTWIFTNQFAKVSERPKFLYNIRFMANFFKNVMRSSESLYLQRVARFQLIRSKLIREELVKYAAV